MTPWNGTVSETRSRPVLGINKKGRATLVSGKLIFQFTNLAMKAAGYDPNMVVADGLDEEGYDVAVLDGEGKRVLDPETHLIKKYRVPWDDPEIGRIIAAIFNEERKNAS